jgi:hypothetical protein
MEDVVGITQALCEELQLAYNLGESFTDNARRLGRGIGRMNYICRHRYATLSSDEYILVRHNADICTLY